MKTRIGRRAPRMRALLLLLAVVSPGLVAAAAQHAGVPEERSIRTNLRLLYHERLSILSERRHERHALLNRAPGGEHEPGDRARVIQLAGYGRIFEVEVVPNRRLIADLPQHRRRALEARVELMRGQLVGNEASWVRLSRIGGRISGMIWDGAELYVLDWSDAITAALPARRETPPFPLMYRLADAQWEDARCSVSPEQGTFTDYATLGEELQSLVAGAAAAGRQLDVAVVADTQFVQASGPDPAAVVLARMNVVDGIFSSQVGVRINVTEVRLLADNGPLSSSSPYTLLEQFSSYAGSSALHNPGLAHLFTGRNLQGSVVGIAWLDSLCSSFFGTAVSMVSASGIASALIVAHEIGHNFGAPHDNQFGSPCGSTPGIYLMNPFINGSDEFSACSISQMQPSVDSASCISLVSGTSSDLRVTLPNPSMSAAWGQAFSYRVEVRNTGGDSAQNAALSIELPKVLKIRDMDVEGGSCIDDGAGQVDCDLNEIAAGAVKTVTFTMKAWIIPRRMNTIVTASADNDDNPSNDQQIATVTILPREEVILSAFFDVDAEGFTYTDDVFRGTNEPVFARGFYDTGVDIVTGGRILTVFGGKSENEVIGMSGAFQRTFTLAAPRRVVLTFRFRIKQTPYYETDEYSEALVAVDGTLLGMQGPDYIARVFGDGDGGGNRIVNWMPASFDLGVLPAGTHTLALGGFNSKKDSTLEKTVVLFDDVVVAAE